MVAFMIPTYLRKTKFAKLIANSLLSINMWKKEFFLEKIHQK